MVEIKVQCPCGQKYKFDVQPLHGRMPGPVSCPVCGADGTAAAEQILQQQLAATAVRPVPVAAPPAPAVRMAAAGHAPPVQVTPRPSVSAPALTRPGKPLADDDSGVREVKIGWKTWGWIILAVVLTLYGVGSKWYRKVRFAQKAIELVAGSDAASRAGSYEWSLPSDDGAMLLVRHTNATVVGQACIDHHRDQLRRALVLATSTVDINDDDPGARYYVWPAHNGCVQLDGAMFWDEAYVAPFTGLAQYLSQRLQVTSVVALMGDDAETGVFAIYEQGQRRFWCQRQIFIQSGDLKEVVRTEGDAWVAGKGFKPAKGFKEFTMDDANDLTRHLGFKLNNRPETTKALVLREGAGRPAR